EPLLAAGFVITAALWLVLSVWVVIDRMRYDRGQRKLRIINRSVSDPRLVELSYAERAAFLKQLLDRLPARTIYRMAGGDELPALRPREWAARAPRVMRVCA